MFSGGEGYPNILVEMDASPTTHGAGSDDAVMECGVGWAET